VEQRHGDGDSPRCYGVHQCSVSGRAGARWEFRATCSSSCRYATGRLMTSTQRIEGIWKAPSNGSSKVTGAFVFFK
jgi:hypothetical protein